MIKSTAVEVGFVKSSFRAVEIAVSLISMRYMHIRSRQSEGAVLEVAVLKEEL